MTAAEFQAVQAGFDRIHERIDKLVAVIVELRASLASCQSRSGLERAQRGRRVSLFVAAISSLGAALLGAVVSHYVGSP
jgi:hypothetical protein